MKGLLNRKLEDPAYRNRHELGMISLKLESDILLEIERRDLSFEEVARLLGTKKSNVSRDLNGGLQVATVKRLKKYADALNMKCDFRMYRRLC